MWVALWLSAPLTTAIVFFAFLPTAYAGVAELGLISGTGMFISLFISLSLLPALIRLFPVKPGRRNPSQSAHHDPALPIWQRWPLQQPRRLLIMAGVLAFCSLLLLPANSL